MTADPANLQQLPGWVQWLLEWLSHQQFVASLLALMTLDIATGLMQALARKTLCSTISFRGVAKKGTMLIIVGVCSVLQPFANGVPLLAPCAGWFIITESISILEHAGSLGVKLPPFLLEALEKIRVQKTIKDMPVAAPGAIVVNPAPGTPIHIEAHVVTEAPPASPPKDS